MCRPEREYIGASVSVLKRGDMGEWRRSSERFGERFGDGDYGYHLNPQNHVEGNSMQSCAVVDLKVARSQCRAGGRTGLNCTLLLDATSH